MIDFTGRKVVIFGGGVVGARKARYFAGEAEVTVYSRSFHSDFSSVPVRTEVMDLIPEPCAIKTLISNSALVIAATSDTALNTVIRDVSRDEGVLCNVAAGPVGDVILPAKISGDNFLIAVSSKGSVPAISRLIREEIEQSFPDLDDLAELGSWIRETYRTRAAGAASYDAILYNALRDPQIRKSLSYGQENARSCVMEKYGP